ncbi:MAG: helix-turn-helix transcriptional regulator [Clostridia bacterium]|nr:helix-turn-helix transcriptional regulator [Clostridia bacterium]
MIDFENHRSDKIEYIYNQNDINLNFQKHTHRSFEVTFVSDGALECEIEENVFELNAGQAILILPGQIHSYKTRQYSKSYLCVFSNDWVHSFYDEVKGFHFENPTFSCDGEYYGKVLQDKKSDKFLIRSVLYRLCSKAYRSSNLQKSNELHFALTNSLAFYIQNNYRKKITLKELAANFGYNYSYLSAYFSKYFGMNFSAYVNSYRIQLAKAYLTSTDKNITEISNICGFETIRNFNRAFKRECGLSPKEYRLNNKTKN